MSRRYDRYDPRDDLREDTRERSTAQYVREVRRGDGRHYETHLSAHAQELVPRPREDSDFSVEEIRRDFPPPGYSRDINRARSAGAYDDDYNRRSHYSRGDDDYDRRSHYPRDDHYDSRRSKKPSSVSEYEGNKRARVLGKQEQILAALLSAGVAMGATYGAKKLMDKKAGKEETGPTQQDIITSVVAGAAGGFAGYQGAEYYNKHQRDKLLAHSRGYVSDEDEDPKQKKGRKNFLESALGAAGLGGAIKAMTGGSSHDDKRSERSDTRSRGGTSRSRSRSKGPSDQASKMQKAAMASLIAGATEAFRISKEPGSWKGEKAKRVLTAAVGAGAIDTAHNSEKSGKLGLAESVIGGLLGNRVLHGSKKNIEEDKKTGRSRSRSRARSEGGGGGATGIAALASAGLGAFGASKLMEHRSRSRTRRDDSDGSRHSSPDAGRRRRSRSRSRSVVDTARRSLARIGIGNGPDDDRDEEPRRRRHQDDYSDSDDGHKHRGSGRNRRQDSDDDDYDDRPRGKDSKAKGRERSVSRGGGGSGGHRRRGSPSESDLGDSDEDRKEARRKRDARRRN